MADHVHEAVQALLEGERVLTAAVVVEGEPVAALLPYVVSEDGTALVVHVSGLARHARGMFDGATVGVVVHAPATPDRDAMQIPRLAVQATARALARSSPEYESGAARLIARHPAARTTLALPDFAVYALTLGRGRYIEGFAQAVAVGPDTFTRR